jgi:hypothetical protein
VVVLTGESVGKQEIKKIFFALRHSGTMNALRQDAK